MVHITSTALATRATLAWRLWALLGHRNRLDCQIFISDVMQTRCRFLTSYISRLSCDGFQRKTNVIQLSAKGELYISSFDWLTDWFIYSFTIHLFIHLIIHPVSREHFYSFVYSVICLIIYIFIYYLCLLSFFLYHSFTHLYKNKKLDHQERNTCGVFFFNECTCFVLKMRFSLQQLSFCSNYPFRIAHTVSYSVTDKLLRSRGMRTECTYTFLPLLA